jgi:hypothetical protein
MSNRFKFEIPAELASQKFTIKAINADGTSSIVENGANYASDEEKLAILQSAIEESKKFTSLEDKNYTKVGYYSSDDIAPLKALVTDANAAIRNSDVANYLPIAESINAYVLWLQADNRMKQISPNSVYSIASRRNTKRYINSTNAHVVNTTTSSSAGNYRRWAFVPVEGEENTYYMMNKYSHMVTEVLNEKGKISGIKTTDTIPDRACTVKIEFLGGGVLGIRPKDETYLNLDPYDNLGVWGEGDEGSQWYITETEVFPTITDEDIKELITLSEDLLEDVSVYTETQTKVELQITDQASAGYLSTNAKSSKESEYPFSKIIDGNEASSSRFQMNSSSTDETPYLKVDLGSGEPSKQIQFYMRAGINNGYAKTLEVYGSTNGSTWNKVADIEGKITLTTDIIKTSTAYRYWRIDLTSSNRPDQKQIGIYEFEFYTISSSSEIKPEFNGVSSTYVNYLRTEIEKANKAMNASYRTLLGDYMAYQNLLSDYNNLYNQAVKIDPTVDINDINGSEDLEGETNSIFDLSGRRVNTANKGVYIINGKKVIK